MDEFAPHTIHFLEVSDVLHGDGVSNILDRGKLRVAHPPIGETHLIILERIIAVLARHQGDHVRVSYYIHHRLAYNRFRIQTKQAAHGGVDQQNLFLFIEDHHAVMDIIEHRFEPRAFGIGDLRLLF